MTKPQWFDAKVTMGNLITITVMVVGFFIWGVRLEARVDDQARSLSDLKATDTNMMGRIEAQRDLASTRQELVLTKLTRLETILERLEKSGVRP